MAEATKLPIKTETKAPGTAPAPWSPFQDLRREIDRIFDSFRLGSWDFPFGRRAFELELPWPREAGFAIAPAVDFAENEKEYELTAELPGMNEKDIEIKLSDDMLTIKGEKKEEKEEREKGYYVSERRYGSFRRTFQLPAGADTGKIEASFAKGVLTVKIPKTAEAQKSEKTISIKAA
jgi:HSP20 family protein